MRLEMLFILTIALLGCAVVVLVFFNLGTEKSKGFTELYFVGDVPASVSAGSEATFSFAIHNREQQAQAYRYVVSAGSNRQQGKVTIPKDKTAVIHPQFSLNETTEERIPVSVQLSDSNQEIRFWVSVQ